MEIFKHLIIALLDIVALTVLVHAQSQSELGFISIDCGLLPTSGYTDEKTGIDYISDASFLDNGNNSKASNIASEYNRDTLEQPFRTVRSFPTGIKNCYTVNLTRPNVKFLIRASFMYGNYDGNSKPPRFDLLLEADVWDTIEFTNASTIVTKEILHLPQRNYVHVCLVNTYSGTPFISSLELRPLNNLIYTTQSGSLFLHLRLDVGSNSDKPIRYKDDIYDRIWTPYTRSDWIQISTSLPVYPDSEYQQPPAVMRTAPAYDEFLEEDDVNHDELKENDPDNTMTVEASSKSKKRPSKVGDNSDKMKENKCADALHHRSSVSRSSLLGDLGDPKVREGNIDDLTTIEGTSLLPSEEFLEEDNVNPDEVREDDLDNTNTTEDKDTCHAASLKSKKRLGKVGNNNDKMKENKRAATLYSRLGVPRSSLLGDLGNPKEREGYLDDLTTIEGPSLLAPKEFLEEDSANPDELREDDLNNTMITEGVIVHKLVIVKDMGHVASSKSKKRLGKVGDNNDKMKENKRADALHSRFGVPRSSLPGDLGDLKVKRGYLDDLTTIKGPSLLASEEFLEEDSANPDELREDDLDNTMNIEGHAASSKSKKRLGKVGDNNDKIKENKRADALHSRFGVPRSSLLGDLGDPKVREGYHDDLTTIEGPSLLALEEFLEEDSANPDELREDDLDNTMTTEVKDTGHAASLKSKKRLGKVGDNNNKMKENNRATALHSRFGVPRSSFLGDLGDPKVREGYFDDLTTIEGSSLLASEEFLEEDSANPDELREDDLDNTMTIEVKDTGHAASSKSKKRLGKVGDNNDKMKENKHADALHSRFGVPRSSLLGDLSDPNVREGYLDDLTTIEDKVMGHAASSKSKKRLDKVGDNNDKMKENKRADAFHSRSGVPRSSLLGDLGDPKVREGYIDDLTTIEDTSHAYSKTMRGDETCDNDDLMEEDMPEETLPFGSGTLRSSPLGNLELRGDAEENILAEALHYGFNKPASSLFGVNPGDGSPSDKGPNLPSSRGKQGRGKAPLSSKGNSANPIGAPLDEATKCVSSDAAAKLVDSSPHESLELAASSTYLSAASAVPDLSLALGTIKEGGSSFTSDLHSHPKIHQMANLERSLKAKEKDIVPLKAHHARLEAEVDNASNKGYKMAQQEILQNRPDILNFMSSPLDKKEIDSFQKKNEAASLIGHPLVEKDGDFDFPKLNTQEDKEAEVPTTDQDAITPEEADPPTNA